MLRRIVLLSVVLCLTSCGLLYYDTGIYEKIRKPTMEFSSFEECGTWIASNIRYKYPDPYRWQAPQETIEKRTGMCVDYSILLLYYAVVEFGADPETSYLFGIETGEDDHMMCVINGELYEPQYFWNWGDPSYWTPIKTMSLTEALNTCYYDYWSK